MRKHGRYVYAPTAVAFGSRIAVFAPGSDILAEFVDGRFEDLKLPESFSPVSLSVDRSGTLYCLLAKQGEFPFATWMGNGSRQATMRKTSQRLGMRNRKNNPT